MSQALYRKYRSRTLAEVVGQKHITDVLMKALAASRIGHAFLFTGPRGTGKTSVARILAHAISDLPYDKDTTHLDIIEIDAASNRRIDDIRDLREKVHVAPTSAPYKVYIIDEVHMLTGESFNALLKTLEEPPAHVIFILATTEVDKLPATIISRTQRFHFRLIPEDEVIAHLRHIADQEKIAIDDKALRLIAQHGEGSFRDSISLLDQLGSLAGKDSITAEMVEMTLGLAPHEQIQKLIEAIRKNDLSTALKTLDELENAGSSPGILVSQLLRALRKIDTPDARIFSFVESLLEVPRSHNPQMKLLAVVARHAGSSQQTPTKSVPLSVTAPPRLSAPVKELRKAPDTTNTHKGAPEPTVTIGAVENLSWEDIMAATAKHAPIHSVLRHANPIYENGTLTLYFNYALHKKKIDDGKYRNVLSQTIAEMYGKCPQIVTTVGTLPPRDKTAASVAELMGGGEEVDVKA